MKAVVTGGQGAAQVVCVPGVAMEDCSVVFHAAATVEEWERALFERISVEGAQKVTVGDALVRRERS